MLSRLGLTGNLIRKISSRPVYNYKLKLFSTFPSPSIHTPSVTYNTLVERGVISNDDYQRTVVTLLDNLYLQLKDWHRTEATTQSHHFLSVGTADDRDDLLSSGSSFGNLPSPRRYLSPKVCLRDSIYTEMSDVVSPLSILSLTFHVDGPRHREILPHGPFLSIGHSIIQSPHSSTNSLSSIHD
jgi:hypothetical protein